MHLRQLEIPRFAPIVVVFSLVVVVVFIIGGFPALSLTGRGLFVLFLPGFSILKVIVPNEFDSLEELILSPIVGLAYASLTALYLSALRIPINAYSVSAAVLLLSVPLLAYSQKRGNLRPAFKSSATPFTYFVLTALIVASAILISLPFPKNGVMFPMGDDPATSTFAATLIAQQAKIPQSWAPYFPEQSSFTYPPGYPSVLAFLYLLDQSLSIPFLASYFSVFFAVIHGEVFVLTRRITHDDRIALCATSFSALTSIGFYQMMIEGRFPALVGIALTLSLLLFSYLHLETGKRKLLLLGSIAMASLFLTYTVSFVTATLFVILFFFLGLGFFPKKKEGILGCGTTIVAGIALSLPWVLNILSRLTIEIPAKEYQTLLVWFDAGSLRSEFGSTNLFAYFGYWLFLFGIVGVLIFVARRRLGSFLLAWFLSIILLMANEIFRIQFPGWYYLQVGKFLNPTLSLPLSVLAGIGTVKAYSFLKGKLQCSRKLVKTSVCLMLIAVVFLSALFYGVEPILERTNPQTCRMSFADYHAMLWLAYNTKKDAVIFNEHWVGTPSVWIPVVSNRRITMPLLSISEVGWSSIMFMRQDESLTIARNPSSAEALSILEKYNVSYIYLSSIVSIQAEEWRNIYNPQLFLRSSHYKLEFHEADAWVIKVIYWYNIRQKPSPVAPGARRF